MIPSLLFALLLQERLEARPGTTCGDCHGESHEQWMDSIHALKGKGCTDCHGKDEIEPRRDKKHLRTMDFVAGSRGKHLPMCAKCHKAEVDHFTESPHYEGEVPARPQGRNPYGCLSCHDPHGTRAAQRRAILSERCAKCHKDGTDPSRKMEVYCEEADTLDRLLEDLMGRLGQDIPGISWTGRSEEAALDAGNGALQLARSFQHRAELKAATGDVTNALGPVRDAAAKAENRIRSFRRGKIFGLLAFLAVMAVNLFLIRLWCIRRYGGHGDTEARDNPL